MICSIFVAICIISGEASRPDRQTYRHEIYNDHNIGSRHGSGNAAGPGEGGQFAGAGQDRA